MKKKIARIAVDGVMGGKIATDWWAVAGLAGNCVAAYKATGAANLAATYINLANPGTYNLTAIGTAITFNTSYGWNGSGGGLNMNTTLPTNFTVAMRAKSTVTDSVNNLWGAYANQASASGFSNDGKMRYAYGAGGEGSISYPVNEFFTHVVTGTASSINGYINGSLDRNVPAAGMSPSVGNLFLMCDNFQDGVHDATSSNQYMSCFVMYNKVLSPSERAALEAVLP